MARRSASSTNLDLMLLAPDAASAKAGDYKAKSECLGIYPVASAMKLPRRSACRKSTCALEQLTHGRDACIASAQEHKRIDSRGAVSVEEHLVYLPHDTSWQKEQRPL